MKITAELVRRKFVYDARTGVFIWKTGSRAGQLAGHQLKTGYRFLSISGRLYLAHRVAWLYVYGEWPTRQLDHENGNPGDDWLTNLRLSTQSQNKQNSRRKKNSKSGFKGVAFSPGHRKKWRANIGPRGNVKFLGRFDTPEEAHAAYAAAARKMYGEFARAA